MLHEVDRFGPQRQVIDPGKCQKIIMALETTTANGSRQQSQPG